MLTDSVSGSNASPTEGKIEKVVATSVYRGKPEIVNLDRAVAMDLGTDYTVASEVHNV